jgi:hypothetical protein
MKSYRKDTTGCQEIKSEIFVGYLIRHKDIGVLILSNFFDSSHLFTVTGLQFLDSAWYSTDHKKFKSVEIFKLSFTVSEIKAIIFIYS